MRRLWASFKAFAVQTDGAILAEALLVIPVVTVFAIGMLEFGSLFWQRQQMETGVRDAARYWARCRPALGGTCSIAVARNIAFHGTVDGSGSLRVPNWYQDSDLAFDPETLVTVPGPEDIVTVTGTLNYQGSPLSGLLGLNLLQISYVHQQRYIGW